MLAATWVIRIDIVDVRLGVGGMVFIGSGGDRRVIRSFIYVPYDRIQYSKHSHYAGEFS